MSYSQTLVVLARLQLDRDFRRAFIADPRLALAELQLTATELESLCQLPTRDVERIGRMAEWHRVQRISEHVPWFDLRLRPELDAIFEDFQRCTAPQLVNRLEAVALCLYIERTARLAPPYLVELARYERTRIELSWSLRDAAETARTESFYYPVEALREALRSPGWPDAAPLSTALRLSFRKVPQLPAVVIRAE